MMPLRKKLLIGAGGLVGLLIAALLVVPLLVDLNDYKSEITARAKEETGRDLAIDGPISLSLLPTPTVRLDGVRLQNAPGSTDAEMMVARSIVVRPSLSALLAGTVAADQVTLIEPTIVLEIDAAGRPNWTLAGSANDSGSLPVRRIEVEQGTVIFRDARSGHSIIAGKSHVAATAASMDGPFSVEGRAVVDEQPVVIDLAVDRKGPAGHVADITLNAAGGKLSFKGTMSELGPGARLEGRATASADNLVLFVETLAKLAGQPPPHVPPLLAGRFSFDGPVELSRTSLAAREFTLALGDDKGTGTLIATLEPALSIDARFKAARLDLDRWLKAVVLPSGIADEPLPEFALPTGSSPPAVATPGTSWLASLTARLALEVGEVIYNAQAVRDVVVQLEARAGMVAVPKLNAVLPGDLVVQAASAISDGPGAPRVSGDFRLEGPKLRETLSWLRVDLSDVPPNKLDRLSMQGRMGSRAGNVQVENLAFELDDIRGKGGITVSFTVPLSIVLRLDLDAIDLDSFVVPGTHAASTASPTDAVRPILALLGPSLGLQLGIAKIAYRGDVVSGTFLDVARQAGTLRLNDLKVASLAGARLEIRGAVANYWTADPRANVVFAFDSPDIDRVAKLAGATSTGLGAVSASGGAAGTWQNLAIRDGTVSTLGSTVRATGTLALLGVTEGRLTSASYKGRIVLNEQPVDATIDASLAGRPSVAAELKAETFDFGKLTRSSQRAPARGRQATAPTAPLALDTAALRGFDGTFRLVAGALAGTAVPFGNADIAAELKEGRLTIRHLKGSLFGGSLDLAGTVDATQPALAFDLKGQANGVRIGDAMRGLARSNEVGSLIKVTLDGVLNAKDIVLRGTGSTIAELQGSLTGGARVSGHVHPTADRFLQVIGAAATGVTGGVIDMTAGNLMSLFGDKGGVGIGNLLNAISLVLNRFVNHDNPLSGDVDIAGGILTDRHLRLQGRGATAAISTHTDLGKATTDTTIAFTIAEDPSAPYLVMTARGPLAGPSFSAVRGQAKDPPGMADIVPTLKKVPSLLPSIPIPTPHIPNPFK